MGGGVRRGEVGGCAHLWEEPAHLAEVVVDVEAPVSQQQKLDQRADRGHLALNHGDVKSSARHQEHEADPLQANTCQP